MKYPSSLKGAENESLHCFTVVMVKSPIKRKVLWNNWSPLMFPERTLCQKNRISEGSGQEVPTTDCIVPADMIRESMKSWTNQSSLSMT